MLATLIDAPFDDDAWLFEIKWDGFRALADVDAEGRVTLVSRNGKDLLVRFPELSTIGRAFTKTPIRVDGEIVTFDAEGRSSFQQLQRRLGGGGPRAAYVVFDVLFAEGRDTQPLPCEERKEILERLVRSWRRAHASDAGVRRGTPARSAGDVIYSRHVVGEGRAMFHAASEQRLEGIIAKRRASPYVQKRSRDWLKIKVQLTQECVICGWTDPRGSRSGFGSLVMGFYEDGVLQYAGGVGTGFDAKSLAATMKAMKPLATDRCPFPVVPKTRRRAHWLVPKLVGEVQFTEWTSDGRMRHPTFIGIRPDKRPEECVREVPRQRR